MTPLDEINLQIERKKHEIASLERAYRQSMKLYEMIQDLVDLVETRKPNVKSRRDISWHQYLNEFCTVSIAVPRHFGKTTALMQWELEHKNCLVWLPQGSSVRTITEYPIVKGNQLTDQFERMFCGTKKQVEYLLIDEYHFAKTDGLTDLQGAILGQNLSANKEDPSFITIKVGTPR
jgi:hypothetical protein